VVLLLTGPVTFISFACLLLCGGMLSLAAAALAQLLHQRLDLSAWRGWMRGHIPLLWAGSLPVWGIFLFFFGASGSFVWGCYTSAVLAVVLAFANYLMLRYREQTIVPRDLIMALNLRKLLGMISPVAVLALLAGLVLFGGLELILDRVLLPTPAYPLAWRLPAALAGALLVISFCRAGRDKSPARRLMQRCGADYAPLLLYGNTHALFEKNGFLAAFLSLCGRPIMEKPEDYGRDAVFRVVGRYSLQGAPPRGRRPHILYIMSEAFSDPTRLAGLHLDKDPIPRIRALMERCPSGYVLAPGYGGGTAHCEFEALSGFSTALTGGISPFENAVNRHESFPALPRRLRGLGYRTVALHPYQRGMYARTEAYPAMGIDRFIDQSGMRHLGKPDGSPYISDAEAYKEALDLLNASEQPLFLHLVTMQNHGDYARKDRFANTIKAGGLPCEADNRALETYVQGLRYTDEATASFLEKLGRRGDEVLVVFWGDHLPGVYPGGFIRDKKRSRYETPFFIWSNRQLPHAAFGTRSPMLLPTLASGLAGLPPTPFDLLLRELDLELHGIHERFCVDARDMTVPPDSLSPRAAELLGRLRMIQYDALLGEHYAEKAGFFGGS